MNDKMNVTSLLNTAQSLEEPRDRVADSPNHSSSAGTTVSIAVHTPTPTPSPETAPPQNQTKMVQSRSPPKLSRTPWEGDHGNPFSLPINLAVETKSLMPIATATGLDPYNESPVDAPRNPSPNLHKFSDSTGSSLSSYTSSSTGSLSHSRISSLSTVGDNLSWPVNMPDLSELLNNAAPGPMEKPEATTSSNMAGTTFADSGTASHPCLQTIHEPSFSRSETQVLQGEESEEDDDDDDLKKKTALTLAPKSVLDNLDAEPRCMFVKDCRTGSQLRKAISHIFGRNKICTRQIPDNIWVHFCRKHYQRCRYRNVQEYAKLQCQLVVKQIQRVQAWSDRNEARNALGVVSGWTLSVRKREQRRMQTKNDGYDSAVLGQKRPYPGFDGLGMDSEADHRFKDPHAVPNWLLEKCDRSYTTDQTIEIFRQIEQELVEDRLRQIPDVEVLPSITHDPNAEIQYKRYEKRKMVEAALMQSQSHKRVQSTGSHWYGLGSGSGQSYTGYSGPDFWWRSQSLQGTGYHGETKHQRVGDYESSFQPQTHMTDIPPRSESRTVPSIWRSGPAAGSYLPAPVAQRRGTQPAAQQLESSNTTTGFSDTHRPAHHRSQSDVSGFRQLPPVGSESAASRFTSVNIPSLSTPNYSQRSSSSYYQQDPPRQGSSYTAAQHGQEHIFGTGVSGQKYTGDTYNTGTSRQSSSYNDISPRQQHPPLTPGPSSYYHQPGTSALPMTGRQGHSRHQSTPTISHTSQQMYGSGSSFHSTVVPEGYPPDNQGYGQRSQQSFASGQSKEDLNE